MSIFVSWRGSDRDVKNELVAALRAALPEETVWESDEGCKSNGYEEFIRQIRRSEIFIVIISDAAMEPSYVINEVITARACEMAGTLNMLVFSITDSPYTEEFEAQLNHISDANRVARLTGTTDGYQQLAKRVAGLLERRRKGDPELPYDAFYPEIKGTAISQGYYVPHSRDDVFEEIDRGFERSNVLVVSQIVGYGRKCVARQYALVHKEEYKTQIVLHGFSGTLRDFFISGLDIQNVSRDYFTGVPEQELIHRKARFLKKLDKDTLLIVPDLRLHNTEDRFVLDALASSGCRIIFITESVPATLKSAFPVIEVHRLQDEHLQELFFNYYEASEEDREALAEPLTQFFNSIDGHTKSVERTAMVLAEEFGVYPEDIPDILRNIHPDSNNELSERIFQLITDLFDMKQFDEAEQNILLIAACFARFPVDEKTFVTWLKEAGCYQSQALRALIAGGWIDNDRAARTIQMDEFFAKVCFARIALNEELLAGVLQMLFEDLVETMFMLNIASGSRIYRQVIVFFELIGLSETAEILRKQSDVLYSHNFEDFSYYNIGCIKETVRQKVEHRFVHEPFKAALLQLCDIAFSLCNQMGSLTTPHDTFLTSSVGSRLTSHALFSEDGVVSMLEQMIGVLEDPIEQTLFKRLVLGLQTGSFGEILAAVEAFTEYVDRQPADEEEADENVDAMLVLNLLYDNLLAAVQGQPLLQLKMCRIWEKLMRVCGSFSYSRTLMLYVKYVEAMYILGIYDDEYMEVCQTALRYLSLAGTEDTFANRDAMAEQECEIRYYYADGMAKAGNTDEALNGLMDLIGSAVHTKVTCEYTVALAETVIRCLVKCSEMDQALQAARAILAYARDDAQHVLKDCPEVTEHQLVWIEQLAEVIEHGDQDDGFGDDAAKQLDYYQRFATENTDRQRYRLYESIAQKAKALDYTALDKDELCAKATELKRRASKGDRWETLAPEAFALVSEAGERVLGYRHHFVQYIGGAAMADGHVAEIQNGEGKTYTILLPAFLHTLYGRQVHIIDASPYLVRRNFSWMRDVLIYLGCRVGLIIEEFHKTDVSSCDVVYSTIKDIIFTSMHEELSDQPRAIRRDVAIVDEADNALVDNGKQQYRIGSHRAANDAEVLARLTYDVASAHLHDDSEAYYVRNDAAKHVTAMPLLIEELIDLCAQEGLNLSHDADRVKRYLEWCLHTLLYYQIGVDYFVEDGRVLCENKRTGRFEEMHALTTYFILRCRQMTVNFDLLRQVHTANVYTVQEFFATFRMLCGTTATASSLQNELKEVYKLSVVRIPCNTEPKRVDHSPLLFVDSKKKDSHILRLIAEKHEKGQPVLLITASVAASKMYSTWLRELEIPHTLLNAENDGESVPVLEQAGCRGAVTVTTAIANRGVDIRLGGTPRPLAKQHMIDAGYRRYDIAKAMTVIGQLSEPHREIRHRIDQLTAMYRQETEAERICLNELGGLCVIGTACFEDLRLEQQMRGRCARQGDEGESYVFFALDDPGLRVLFRDRAEAMRRTYSVFNLDALDLSNAKRFRHMLDSARVRSQNARNFDLFHMPQPQYYPAARKAILGLADRLVAEEVNVDTLIERYFASAPRNIDTVLAWAKSEDPSSPLHPLCVHVREELRGIGRKQVPSVLKLAVARYRQSRDMDEVLPSGLVRHILRRNLVSAWERYNDRMAEEYESASAMYTERKRLIKHLVAFSGNLTEHLIDEVFLKLAKTVVLPKQE